MIRFRISEEIIKNAVLYFEIRQYSSNEKLLESKYAAILPLFKNHLIISNSIIDVPLFKSKSAVIDIPSYFSQSSDGLNSSLLPDVR